MYAWSCVPGCVFGYLLCPWMCGHVYVFNSAFGCVSLNMCFTISMMVSLDVCLTACLAASLNAMEFVLGYITDNIFHCMHDWVPHYTFPRLFAVARFIDFFPAIQIRWKLRLVVIPLLTIKSQHIFEHGTTAQLSCHAQNFVAIAVLKSRWEWNEMWSKNVP